MHSNTIFRAFPFRESAAFNSVPSSFLQTCSVLYIQCTVQYSARIYRPSFRENKPKTGVFSHRKRAFSAGFRENWVYKFGHSTL
jgi:hypothetical protein